MSGTYTARGLNSDRESDEIRAALARPDGQDVLHSERPLSRYPPNFLYDGLVVRRDSEATDYKSVVLVISRLPLVLHLIRPRLLLTHS